MVAILLVGVAFDALRAGSGTFRALIDLPARRALGAIAFAEFSRATDLSPLGVAFWVGWGVGGALLTGAAWVVAVRSHAEPVIRRLTLVAAASSLLILVLTTQAAPLMWSIGASSTDVALLGDLLNRFTRWTELRVACADVSFVALLAALARLAWPAPQQVTQ